MPQWTEAEMAQLRQHGDFIALMDFAAAFRSFDALTRRRVLRPMGMIFNDGETHREVLNYRQSDFSITTVGKR